MSAGSLLDVLPDHNLEALWAPREQSIGAEPFARETAIHWPWNVVQPIADRAGDEVSMQDAERRVLLLANPSSKFATVGTLNAAVQVLNPGDIAEPHRHSIAALRLITDYDGGITTVDGVQCPMAAGDLILTPAWCWHGHFNDTNRRLMWVDVLDAALVAGWDAVFFEHPGAQTPKLADAVPFCDLAWSGAGIVQADLKPVTSYSPKLRYAWTETKPALDAGSPLADASREVRYVNPLNGRPVLPTLDCYAVRLERGCATRPKRSTASMVCYVIEGEGHSCVGDRTFNWSRNDVFTVPHWQWVSHTAEGGAAYIAQVTNKGMLETLGILREELT
ncbi:cupin domain-containing protein [Roseiarcaceae bacterium H3SJ34-1]|uniref:cupin domain-containing protein n=1 Tax=Terripilifer ovatus TaxID=3032367 RepID=UPI003AB994F1|nr:cupin domain-containing protein [Roseiarcaceae bacterium H3SJ34-1]